MTLSDRKSDLRKSALLARDAVQDVNIASATQRLLAVIGPAQGLCIAGYMPIKSEIDPRPAMAALHAAGAVVCVPVVMGKGRALQFKRWAPDIKMVPGPFGAAVPEHGGWVTPNVLIVPLVAFDGSCARLGYGGGFYDRSLQALRTAGPVRAMGLALDVQEVPKVPQEPTDQRLDAIVTATRTVWALAKGTSGA